MPTSTLNNKTPFELLFHQNPNYMKLKQFGCLCYPLTRPYNTRKLQTKVVSCVFVGYSLTQNAYLCLDLLSKKVNHSRHVLFDETIFPMAQTNTCSSAKSQPVTSALGSSHPVAINLPLLYPARPSASIASALGTAAPSSPLVASPPKSVPSQVCFLAQTENSSENLIVSHAPVVLPTAEPRPHRMVTRSMNNIYKPKSLFMVTKHPLPPSLEPISVTQALTDPQWRAAMSSELTALMRHDTWHLVPPLKGCNIIGCKWVFQVKRLVDGSIDKFKARLVAKGFNRRPGLDYTQTFSPIVKPVTIRTILSVAVMHGWPLHQLDINNAFLHGNLTEEVYMSQPPGFRDQSLPDYVCCLKKAIYGLKQAPRASYTALKQALLEFGFVNTKSDSSLFVYTVAFTTAYFLVYVDDLIITNNKSYFAASIIQQLGRKFSLKDLGPLHFFLGIEVIPTQNGLFLTQHKYIRDLLARTCMDGAKDVTTSLSTSVSLKLNDGSAAVNPTEYRKVIGALQYLSLTRPNISFAVNKLSQLMHCPSTIHWTATKQLLRYLKNTIFHGISIQKNVNPPLTCYSDADWAGNLDNRSSTSAYLIMLGSNLLFWSSRKQRAIARSSTEAEYRALATAASESMWILSLFTEIKFSSSASTALM
jgi:hypothetical protein